MVYDKRVTIKEVRHWIKWLQKEGHEGPFTGVTPGNIYVRKIEAELQKPLPDIKDPIKNRDRRTIAANLNRYGNRARKKKPEPEAMAAAPVIDFRPYLRDHWHKLGSLAQEVSYCLELQRISRTKTRFGDKISPDFSIESTGIIHFSAQSKYLWPRLMQHLDAEFTEPSFTEELEAYFRRAPEYIENGDWQFYYVPQFVRRLQDKLKLVIERGTFIGTCDICRTWLKPES